MLPLILLHWTVRAAFAAEPLPPQPKIQAPEILSAALDALNRLPSTRRLGELLSARNTTLEIGHPPSDSPAALATYEPAKNTILFGAPFLDSVYSEMDALGLESPAEIGRHIGLKLVPALAHETCHEQFLESMRQAGHRDLPDTAEEEALCLYAEMGAWRDLWTAHPWEMSRTRTDLDRVSEGLVLAWLSNDRRMEEVARQAYPSLDGPSARGGEPSPLAQRSIRAGKEIDRVLEKIRSGGRGLEDRQKDLARLELLSEGGPDLSALHPPRPRGSAGRPTEASAAQAKALLAERLKDTQLEFRTPEWTAFLEQRYPELKLSEAGTDAERLEWSLRSALKLAKAAPDLLWEGNPYYYRTAKALAERSGRDIGLETKEVSRLEQAKIERLLANAARLGARGDASSRNWSWLCLRRAETESREVWDMMPQWIAAPEERVLIQLKKAAQAEK